MFHDLIADFSPFASFLFYRPGILVHHGIGMIHFGFSQILAPICFFSPAAWCRRWYTALLSPLQYDLLVVSSDCVMFYPLPPLLLSYFPVSHHRHSSSSLLLLGVCFLLLMCYPTSLFSFRCSVFSYYLSVPYVLLLTMIRHLAMLMFLRPVFRIFSLSCCYSHFFLPTLSPWTCQ